jgi:hypothetical protein
MQIAGYPVEADGIMPCGDQAGAKFAVFPLKGAQVQVVETIAIRPRVHGRASAAPTVGDHDRELRLHG